MVTNLSLRRHIWLLFIIPLLFSCKENPETFAIHSPIYPSGTEAVSFTLRKIDGNVSEVKLFEFVANVNSQGDLSATTPETEIQSWSSPSFPLTFTRSSGYGSNKLVTYRFQVKGNNKTYNHRISFATRPYPVPNQAAPVYVVGNQDKVLNLVFIPDTSMNSRMTLFYNSVRSQIDSTFHQEDWVRRFRSSYNFYINPVTAIARDFDSGLSHVLPSNSSELSFAQGKVILHFHDIRDQAGGGYFSAEYYVRGTMLHESGHSLYRLADEYDSNSASHWEEPEFPNNWDNQSDAEAAAPGYNKTTADVRKMGTQDWYRICNNQCPMRSSGTPINNYDEPCKTRILHTLLKRASN
ncbi:MAG: hypothetical protein KIT80_14670 [Chitinophagaceae bacterium]|nr:hypothetical protein [Chitinophagaceae bacterium]MCW5928158.1 hypothetical protein [Chitinophagaceae bacterium]